MYSQFFGFEQIPFSIAPDPRYLFMSEQHREALAHLLYGLEGGGGFVVLTGEIGTGKTTVCRAFLQQMPKHCNVAYVFNPKLTSEELLSTICEEFHVELNRTKRLVSKDLVDALNVHLLQTHAQGQNNILIVDEAQNLSTQVLEQLRLLTNLETSERKLLQIILIGQPELRDILAQPQLEQLAQRVIARYHLRPLLQNETAEYIFHRLWISGLRTGLPFDVKTSHLIHQITGGIPRKINLLCDRALLGAYAKGLHHVDAAMLKQAAYEVFSDGNTHTARLKRVEKRWKLTACVLGALLMVACAALAWQHKEVVEQKLAEWGLLHNTVADADRSGSSASVRAPAP